MVRKWFRSSISAPSDGADSSAPIQGTRNPAAIGINETDFCGQYLPRAAPICAMRKPSKERLLELHRAILLPRMIEEKMLNLLRQGRLSKWFSGIGQEAIAVGVASALRDDDYILPMHRNLGVFTARGLD